MHKNKQGFTIVELLIVITIIAVLATIAIVSYRGVQRRSADVTTRDTASKAVNFVRTSLTMNRTLPNLASDFKAPDRVEVTLVSGGVHYSGLSAVQNGVLFSDVCQELLTETQYTVIHALAGGATDTVFTRCDDSTAAGQIQITGWQSRTWSTPLARSTLESYIASVPYDVWWTDRQAVVRGFYTELINRFVARGGSFPITSFWDPWANAWSGVHRQALPAPDPSDENNYCINAAHRTYTDIVYHASISGGLQEGSCGST